MLLDNFIFFMCYVRKKLIILLKEFFGMSCAMNICIFFGLFLNMFIGRKFEIISFMNFISKIIYFMLDELNCYIFYYD